MLHIRFVEYSIEMRLVLKVGHWLFSTSIVLVLILSFVKGRHLEYRGVVQVSEKTVGEVRGDFVT